MNRLTSLLLLIAAAFAVSTIAFGLEAVPVVEGNNAVVNNVGAVPTRDEIMSCAQNWVDREVPYCQCNGAAECCGSCPYCGTFRCDCSGYVTYCLQLPAGLNTNSLPAHGVAITKDELQKGDFMDCAGDHVVFFAGWTDASKTAYVVYQEPGCHTATVHHAYKSVTTYPFGNNACFKPYRRVGLAATPEVAAGESLNNMASADDLKEAFLYTPYLTGHTKEEADTVLETVRAHGKDLGYFTY